MSHAFDVGEAGLELAQPEQPPAGHPLVARLDSAMKTVNRWVMVPCMLAVVVAAAILTYSVAARYFFKIPTEWQDETAIFLLMGATFFSAAFVQSYRGHVGVEAVASLLSPRLNHWRMLFVEVVSFAFCAWGPPMWIPYLLMAAGMTLLALQLLLEVIARVANKEEGK